MYGYIRPDRGQLRLIDLENYQAVYCGLCHALKKRCGVLARFTVSYDLTFLVLLLADKEEHSCKKRCVRHPFSRKRCLCASDATDITADRGMILLWWKLRDSVGDDSGLKRLLSRLACFFLRKAYRKAADREAEFDKRTASLLQKLHELEAQQCDSIDKTADCFGRILSGCAEGSGNCQRILEELLYHVGRSIYLLDAADDMEEDRKNGSYNPLLLRYPQWDDEAKDSFRRTMNLSQKNALAAFYLLEEKSLSPITENILTLGLPKMTELVLSGQWKNRKKLLRERSRESGIETI